MAKEQFDFQDLLKHQRTIDAKLAADPTYQGPKAEGKPAATLLDGLNDDDPFGGNENNRRAAELLDKTKKVVEGKAPEADLKKLQKEQAKKVAAETKKVNDSYQENKVTADGVKPVWRPNA